MNSAVRKIHNLQTSGAVTVSGPNQARILKQKITTNAATAVVGNNLQQQVGANNRCYVCDDALAAGQAQHSLSKMATSHTATKFPNKIGHLVGEAFTVIICADDVVCARCTNLINYLDRLENDVERVRSNLINLLHRKYGLNDDGGGGGGVGSSDVPPQKMQKLNSGATVIRAGDDSVSGGVGGVSIAEINRTRKVVQMSTSDSPMVSAVQQIKISTQPTQQQTPTQQQQQQLNTLSNTQTMQRKTTRIYKCLTCEYKTSDMRLFNTHFETCKQQNFQCKNCKQIFPNFGTMKQHMVREHNTSMDNTCSVCHINFVSEGSLRKHMELNHSTNVVVTTTVPMSAVVKEVVGSSSTTPLAAANALTVAAAAAAVTGGGATTTPLYACTQCQFKTTDKSIYDEHLRKHISPGGKPKPFKCRLCSQRFETRDAATIHAKQHQPNYFKCGTCSMSFSKRDQLVKHFEVHQQQLQQQHILSPNATAKQQQQTTTTTATTSHQQQQQQQSSSSSTSTQNLLTTQKLLQETIDEALSDTVVSAVVTQSSSVQETSVGATTAASASASNIRFYSCNVCSLTFLQENYYNQHMETHRRDEKKSSSSNINSTTTIGSVGRLNALSGGVGGGSSGNGGSGTTAASALAVKKGDNGLTNSQVDANSAAEVDIESIFEKMHSEKSDNDSPINAGVVKTNAAGDKTSRSKDNLVITSQAGSGGITFNITIPETAAATAGGGEIVQKKTATSIDMPTLDQPDELMKIETNDEAAAKSNAAAPVSMPSLDDDGETAEQQAAADAADKASSNSGRATPIDVKTTIASDDSSIKAELINESEKHATNNNNNVAKSEQMDDDDDAAAGGHDAEEDNKAGEVASHQDEHMQAGDDEHHHHQQQHDHEQHEHEQHHHHHQQVAMELDEAMQAQVESGQIKFILNENGQLLQLDNHIITDAEGNQILVQDPEQIQQLLQSVGVLQTGDAIDGETLQMMTDNGQMVLVHGENNETQLIDASLLNADGQLVIQQGQDGELDEGTHVISEDGTRIPVSVSYTADGQPIVQVQQVLSGGGGGGASEAETATDDDADVSMEEKVAVTAAAGGESSTATTTTPAHNDLTTEVSTSSVVSTTAQTAATASSTAATITTTASGNSSGSGSGFFALEDLMQQQQQQQHDETESKTVAE